MLTMRMLLVHLPSNRSNTSGKIPNMIDFPYPVGKDTKVSWPLKNVNIASSCLSFRVEMPQSCKESLKASL